jgi:hypothetical protein
MANHKRKGPKSTRAGCLMCVSRTSTRLGIAATAYPSMGATFSKIAAIPCPPPMHIVSRP